MTVCATDEGLSWLLLSALPYLVLLLPAVMSLLLSGTMSSEVQKPGQIS